MAGFKRLLACGAAKLVPAVNYEEKYHAWASELRLSPKHVKQAVKLFRQIDKPGTDGCSAWEVLHTLKLSTAPFFQYILAIFDTNRDKKVDFSEFMSTMWAFCAPTRNGLIRLCFDLYDFDNDGKVSTDEIATMIREVHGKNAETKFPRLAALLANLPDAISGQTTIAATSEAEEGEGKPEETATDVDEEALWARQAATPLTRRRDGTVFVTFGHFITFVRRSPIVLLPVFGFQDQMKAKLFDKGYWSKLAEPLWRALRTEGKTVDGFAHLVTLRDPLSEAELEKVDLGEAHVDDRSSPGPVGALSPKNSRPALQHKVKAKHRAVTLEFTAEQRRHLAQTQGILNPAVSTKMAANASAKHADQVVFTFDEDVSVVDSAVSSHRRAEKSRGIMAKATGNSIERHKSELAARMAAKQRTVLSPKTPETPFRNAKVAPEL